MRVILRRGWIGLLIFVSVLTVANLLLHFIEAGQFDRRTAIVKADQYRGEIIRDGYGVPHIYGQRDVDVAFAWLTPMPRTISKPFNNYCPSTGANWGAVSALTGCD